MRPLLMVSDVLDLHDARYCAAVGIELLGFDLGMSGSASTPAEVSEIMDWLSGTRGIAVFQDEPSHAIMTAVAAAKSSYVSVPLRYDTDQLDSLEVPVILRVNTWDDGTHDLLRKLGDLPTGVFLQAPIQFVNEIRQEPGGDSIGNEKLILVPGSAEELAAMLARVDELPFAFCLDVLVKDEEGRIDYEKCDELLSRLSIALA